jgi:hypothetical protein
MRRVRIRVWSVLAAMALVAAGLAITRHIHDRPIRDRAASVISNCEGEIASHERELAWCKTEAERGAKYDGNAKPTGALGLTAAFTTWTEEIEFQNEQIAVAQANLATARYVKRDVRSRLPFP